MQGLLRKQLLSVVVRQTARRAAHSKFGSPYTYNRTFQSSTNVKDVPQWPNPPVPQPVATPYSSNDSARDGQSRTGSNKGSVYAELAASPIVQAGVTTVIGLIAVFGGGILYLTWYKAHVLNKMEGAFAAGYDPALEVGKLHHKKHLLDHHHHHRHHTAAKEEEDDEEEPRPQIIRKEQDLVNKIVRGEMVGNYWLLMGSKGTGKKHTIVESMRAIQADGAAFAEAHGDLEVFRLRVGKALHYEFNEDWQGSLFSRRDPREGGPRLDIERAMNKLEKVALRYTEKRGRPLVLALSDIHLFPNDAEGVALIHQLQQRAEAWAEAGICSMIFTTDDYWPYEAMKKNATRLKVISVPDLSAVEARNALRYLRACYGPQNMADRAKEREQVPQVLKLLGGRISFLLRAAKAHDMLSEAKEMLAVEKEWLLSRIGLIPDHDDDVMDEQKWSSLSWSLLKEFVKLQKAAESGSEESEVGFDLPKMTYGDARIAMSRTDFIPGLDHDNIVSIDNKFYIRPDSKLILRAAEEYVAREEFENAHDSTMDRVNQIEALHRQNELTVKEGFKIMLPNGKSIMIEGLGPSYVPSEGEEEDPRQC